MILYRQLLSENQYKSGTWSKIASGIFPNHIAAIRPQNLGIHQKLKVAETGIPTKTTFQREKYSSDIQKWSKPFELLRQKTYNIYQWLITTAHIPALLKKTYQI